MGQKQMSLNRVSEKVPCREEIKAERELSIPRPWINGTISIKAAKWK